jgi:hypothetical protein
MPDDRIQDEPRPEDEQRPRRRVRIDDEEERPRRRRVRQDDEDDSGGVNSLIPYKNPQALISYYLGVFALIPCLGIPLAIGAIILGILGLKYRKTHPTAGGTAHAWVGIVLGTLVLPGNLVAFVLFRTLANI